MSKEKSKNDVEKTTVKKTTKKAIPKEFLGWYEVKKKVDAGESEWISFKTRKRIIVQITDYELKTFEYTGDKNHWQNKDYIQTNKGKLTCGARMKEQILPFALEDYRGKLLIEAEGESLDRYYYVSRYEEAKPPKKVKGKELSEL